MKNRFAQRLADDLFLDNLPMIGNLLQLVVGLTSTALGIFIIIVRLGFDPWTAMGIFLLVWGLRIDDRYRTNKAIQRLKADLCLKLRDEK